MTTTSKKKRPAPGEGKRKTEYHSSWSTDGPVTVEVERSDGSAQMMWLKFSRKGFDGRVYLRLESAKEIHAQLGKLIADAEAALAHLY
jgi:hypothetical protein